MKTGFYVGSFDPFTFGHMHVITQSLKLFDKLIVGIGINPDKKRRFDQELMRETIEKVMITAGLSDRVTVITFSELTFDIALKHKVDFLVKGVRNGMDYEYEENQSKINEKYSGLDTIYIRGGELAIVSSSMVMQLLKHGKDVSEYLPKEVLETILPLMNK